MAKYKIAEKVMERNLREAKRTPSKPKEEKEEKEELGKIPKEAVLYTFRPETQYTCSVCVFAKDKDYPDKIKKCKVLGPSADIKPEGSCGFWIHMDPTKEGTPEIPWMGVVTKVEAGYMENKEGFSCKRCEYFDPENLDCHRVDKDSEGDTPGIIHPNACCNAWEADDIRAYLKPAELQEVLEKATAKMS